MAQRAAWIAAGVCRDCGGDSGGRLRCWDCAAKKSAAHEISRAGGDRKRNEWAPLDAVVEGERRPRTLAECPEGPCPWVGCRHHMAISRISKTGEVVMAFPELGDDVLELEETCSLRAAALGAHRLHAIGRKLNLHKQQIEMVEAKATRKCAKREVLVEAGFRRKEAA